MKIDTSKINGYSEMTAEEKLRVLEDYELDSPVGDASELSKLKSALDKATSEAASYKKALREKQTAEEAKAAADAEERESIIRELDALKKDKVISSHRTAYLELGYDAETADANAKALHAGDFATVFANQKKFIEAQKKTAAAAAIDSQPALTNGNPVTGRNAGDKFTADVRKFAGLPTT